MKQNKAEGLPIASGSACKCVEDTSTKVLHGKIKLFIGPMFARKTSSMIAEIERYTAAKKRCMIIKHQDDKRYDNKSNNISVVTHAGNIFDKCPIATAGCMKDVENSANLLIQESDVIAISEGQFYDDIAEYANIWANRGKIVIIEGLSGDYLQRPFSSINKLISIADSIVQLKAICMKCFDNDASFTIRTTKDSTRVVIGGADKYLAICRGCKIKYFDGR